MQGAFTEIDADGSFAVSVGRTHIVLTYQQAFAQFADFDNDGDVDNNDVLLFEACASGPSVPLMPGCKDVDFDSDGDVDLTNFAFVQLCYSGPNNPSDPNCGN